MRPSSVPLSPFSLALWSGAALLLIGAAVVHRQKTSPTAHSDLLQSSLPPIPPRDRTAGGENDTRAVALLQKVLQTDLGRSYQAHVVSETRCNGKVMRCAAQITHAPRALTVHIAEGDAKGASAGYNDRWMWSEASQVSPLQAIAEVSEDAVSHAQHRFKLLLQNYRVTSHSAATPASDGTQLEIVQMVPRHPFAENSGEHALPKPIRVLAIDPQTGLIMRSQACDTEGHPISDCTLSEVKWLPSGGNANQAFVKPQTIAAVSQHQTDPWLVQQMGNTAQDALQVSAVTGIQPPHPAYLPPTFALETVGVHYCPADNQAAAIARYTDGLSTLTVFALSPGHNDGPLQNCNYGAAQMAVSAHGGAHVVAIGDLPMSVLQHIADSTPVTLVPKSAAHGSAVAPAISQHRLN